MKSRNCVVRFGIEVLVLTGLFLALTGVKSFGLETQTDNQATDVNQKVLELLVKSQKSLFRRCPLPSEAIKETAEK
jgi:hypothetical protein